MAEPSKYTTSSDSIAVLLDRTQLEERKIEDGMTSRQQELMDPFRKEDGGSTSRSSMMSMSRSSNEKAAGTSDPELGYTRRSRSWLGIAALESASPVDHVRVSTRLPLEFGNSDNLFQDTKRQAPGQARLTGYWRSPHSFYPDCQLTPWHYAHYAVVSERPSSGQVWSPGQ